MKYYVIVVSLILITACKKNPTASFTVDKKDVAVNEKISLINTSTHQKTCVWDFGDGTTATENEPQKSYDKAGTYVIKLTSYARGEKKRDIAFTTINVGTNNLFNNYYKGDYYRVYQYVQGGTIFTTQNIEKDYVYYMLKSQTEKDKIWLTTDIYGFISGSKISIPNQTFTKTTQSNNGGGTTNTYSESFSVSAGSGSITYNDLSFSYRLEFFNQSQNTTEITTYTFSGKKF